MVIRWPVSYKQHEKIFMSSHVFREIYLKALTSEPKKWRNMRQLFVITCSLTLSKWLCIPCHVLTALLHFQEPHSQMRNVSAAHATRWGERAFVLHVSYIPVRKIKLQRAGRAEWPVNLCFTWDEESREGAFGRPRELVSQVMSLLEHWRRNTSQLEWKSKE